MNLKLSLGLCASLLLCNAFAASDIVEQTFEVKPGGKLVMNVDRGSIHVSTTASEKVAVRVERELRFTAESKAQEVFDRHQVEFNQEGDTVSVRAENPRKSGWFGRDPLNKLRVVYKVEVPEQFNVDIRTAGGNLEISRLEGEIKARTSGGNISVAGTRGNAELRTSGGNLRIGEVEGDVVARTSGGNIEVRSVTGSADVETSGGNVRVLEAQGPVRASTSGGHVSAQLQQQPKSDCLLRTSGGNVSISLPGDVAVHLEASTSGGRIHSDYAGDMNKQRTKLHAEINGGGPKIVLSTSGGNIDIDRQ